MESWTAVAAVAACLAAIGAHLSARATAKSMKAQLALQFMQDYASEEMCEHLRTLAVLKDSDDSRYKSWAEAMANNEEPFKIYDRARRHVKYHFMNALHLKRKRYLNKKLLQLICGVNGINLLYEVVEKMDQALPGKYDKKAFDELRTICPHYDI